MEIAPIDIGVYILLYYVLVLLIATLALIFRIPLFGVYSILGFVLVSVSVFFFYEIKPAIGIILILLIIIVTSVVVSGVFFDPSWDGNSYRKTSIYMLAMGWNPVYEKFASSVYQFTVNSGFTGTFYLHNPAMWAFWYDTYPKADLLFAAVIYLLTGNIESGKAFNILFITALFTIAYTLLKDLFKLKRYQALMLGFALTISPVSLAQVFTYYNDGALAAMVFIFVASCVYLMMYPDGIWAKHCWIAMFLTVIIGFNFKLSAPLFFAIFMIPFYFYQIYIHYKKHLIRACINITIFFTACVVSSLVFFGATSYLVNTIRFQNPVFGSLGRGAVDIITPNTPGFLLHEPRWSQFIHTMFGIMSNSGDGNLRTPFVLTNTDIVSMFSHMADFRIAGWGGLFSGIFLISVLIINIYLIKSYENRNLVYWIAASLVFLIFAPILFIPGLWWARYYPHPYILTVIALVILFCWLNNAKHRRAKFISVTLSAIMSLLIILNVAPNIISMHSRWDRAVQIRDNFEDFQRVNADRLIRIRINYDLYGPMISLIDAGITNFIVDPNLYEFDGILLAPIDIPFRFEE